LSYPGPAVDELFDARLTLRLRQTMGRWRYWWPTIPVGDSLMLAKGRCQRWFLPPLRTIESRSFRQRVRPFAAKCAGGKRPSPSLPLAGLTKPTRCFEPAARHRRDENSQNIKRIAGKTGAASHAH